MKLKKLKEWWKRIKEPSKTYHQTWYCDNCNHFHIFNILKGIPVLEYIKGKECEECRCDLLKSYQKREN